MSQAPRRPAQPGTGPLGPAIVLIPTYNERGSLPQVVRRVRRAAPEVDVLVIDDASPDGTGAVADDLAHDDRQVRVLHRPAKEGLGAAYLDGFRWAMSHGYDVLVEMDADGSHPPERLPAMLEALRDADLIIGSRWVPGGSVVNWPRRRELLSRGSNLYTRLALGLAVHDATAGYRAYRASALREIGAEDVTAQGYFFQVDLTRRLARAGLRIIELPITFVERETGDSKMSGDVIKDSAIQVTREAARYRLGQVCTLPRTLLRREPTWHRLED